MAQYFTDFRENAIASGTPAGWTARWSTSNFTRAIEADASGHNASGKRLALAGAVAAAMKGVSWNALDADADRATVQVRVLIRSFAQSDASANFYGGPYARGSGASSSENAVFGGMGTDSTGFDEDIRAAQAAAGSRTYVFGGNDAGPGAWVPAGYYWLTTTISGTTATTTIASVSEPETVLHTAVKSDLTVTAAGHVGFLIFSSLANFHILAFSVGTGADTATFAPVAPTTAPTIGTITPSGTTASVPYTGLDLYATGVEYRLNGGAWVDAGVTNPIELTGLTESTPYDIEVRAYNAAGPGPVSTLATFTTTAGTTVKGATITLYSGATPQANLTDLRVLWWDATAPDGMAPDYYSATESTDAAGLLSIDLDAVTTLSVGDYGYLHVHKAGTLGNQYRDALVFAGSVQVQDIG